MTPIIEILELWRVMLLHRLSARTIYSLVIEVNEAHFLKKQP